MNNNPDIDPANNGSLAGAMRFAFYKLLQNTNGMLPAKVIKYNRTTNRVQVQILIALVTTDGAQVSRPQIASIPVLVLGGGGFMLSFPLNPGDIGWVMANDRDISLFLQTYKEAAPNTGRVCNFSDALFIPDIMTNYSINSEDAGNAVLQSVDGTVRISLWPNQVKITAPTIIVNGDLTVTGSLTANGFANFTNGVAISVVTPLTYALSVTGVELVTGGFSVVGAATSTTGFSSLPLPPLPP